MTTVGARALKTRGNTPKYGLIFHSSFIGRAKQRNKGRISRYLANKCSIASRCVHCCLLACAAAALTEQGRNLACDASSQIPSSQPLQPALASLQA